MARLIAWTIAAVLSSSLAWGQPYPAKPIKLVAPSTPGDAPDVIARLVADKLSPALGQQVVVENRPGAGGVVGSDYVAKALPDGYTLIMGNAGSHGINAAVYSTLPYDIQRDFAPVSQVAVAPNVMVINPSVPANSVSEFIAYAKANPGKLSYASGGNGSSAHMSMELFKSMSGIDIQHVPYKGSSPALTDVVSGQVVAFIGNMPPTVPLIKAGKLRAYAFSGAKRSQHLPDVPTMTELGYPEIQFMGWVGMIGSPKLKPDLLAQIQKAVAKAASAPAVRQKLLDVGLEPEINTDTSALQRETREMSERNAAIVRKYEIRM